MAMAVQPEVRSQDMEAEIDSLITLFQSAGRNWGHYAEMFIEIGEPMVPALIRQLQDTSLSQWNRRIAAMTLNDIHSPTYMEPALDILMDRSEELGLRNQVIPGLRGYDLSHLSGELWKMYHEEDRISWRLNMAGLLDYSDTALAYQAYEQLYLVSDGYHRQQALKNLVRLRPEESSYWFKEGIQLDDWMAANLAMDSLVVTIHFDPEQLLQLYDQTGTPETVRWRIIYIFGHRPEREYLEILVEALSDPGWLVHNEAAVALTRMPPDRVTTALQQLETTQDGELAGRVNWILDNL
jgi:HEAT repeat protein